MIVVEQIIYECNEQSLLFLGFVNKDFLIIFAITK